MCAVPSGFRQGISCFRFGLARALNPAHEVNEMPYFKGSDGTQLFYEECGEGRPLVLIHGWPLSSRMWEYQMTALSQQGIRCIAYDRRGFGLSDHPRGGFDYDTLADDLKALLDTLDLKEVTLAGFSMGGGEAVRYLSRHGSGRVAKVALIGAVPPCLAKSESNPRGVPKTVFDGIVAGITKNRPEFFTTFFASFFNANTPGSPVTPSFLAATCEDAMRASITGTLACVRGFAETDFRPDLPNVAVPLLVIHGDSDRTVPAELSGKLTAKLVPHARLSIYEKAPHGLTFTHKDQLNAELAAFVLGTG